MLPQVYAYSVAFERFALVLNPRAATIVASVLDLLDRSGGHTTTHSPSRRRMYYICKDYYHEAIGPKKFAGYRASFENTL